jgi:hypothetical protein
MPEPQGESEDRDEDTSDNENLNSTTVSKKRTAKKGSSKMKAESLAKVTHDEIVKSTNGSKPIPASRSSSRMKAATLLQKAHDENVNSPSVSILKKVSSTKKPRAVEEVTSTRTGKTKEEIFELVEDYKKTLSWKLTSLGNMRRLIVSFALRLRQHERQHLSVDEHNLMFELLSTPDDEFISSDILDKGFRILKQVGDSKEFWELCGLEERILNEMMRITQNISNDELGQGLHKESTPAEVKKVYDRMEKPKRTYIEYFPNCKKTLDIMTSVWSCLSSAKALGQKGKVQGSSELLYKQFKTYVNGDIIKDTEETCYRQYVSFAIVPTTFFQVIDYVQKVNSCSSITFIRPTQFYIYFADKTPHRNSRLCG